MFWDQTLWGLFQRGGFVMWPLLLCSVVAMAIVLERFYYHWRTQLDEGAFRKELKKLLFANKRAQALTLSQSKEHAVAKIAEHYLLNLPADGHRANILKCEGSLLLEGVERNLKLLATIAHLSPLLGLLGTVTGLVGAFHQIELLDGQVQAGHLAGGIWEALVTTVFGLCIAIPATAFFHYFENKVDFIARRMQLVITELDRFFGKETHSSFRIEEAEKIENETKTVK